MDAGWAKVLHPWQPQIASLLAADEPYLPQTENVLRAFSYPFDEAKVLVVGQDPYPTPGHAIGLSFAVDRGARPLPRSLQNIYRELRDDVAISTPEHGDLSVWAARGVMLLNRVLTVRPGEPGSHRGRGWEAITEAAVRALVARDKPLVAILWGREAQVLAPILGSTPVIASVHPSPLSASRGFFGSRPFSRANELLSSLGASPVDWSLD